MNAPNNDFLTEKHLNAFDALPSIEPDGDWNNRVIAKLTHSRKSSNNLNRGLIMVLAIFAILNGIALFSQYKKSEKTSAIHLNKYKVISQDLFFNPGSIND